MVKGISRRVIVVESPDPHIFEQAIFILSNDAAGGGVSSQQVVEQAVRIARALRPHPRGSAPAQTAHHMDGGAAGRRCHRPAVAGAGPRLRDGIFDALSIFSPHLGRTADCPPPFFAPFVCTGAQKKYSGRTHPVSHRSKHLIRLRTGGYPAPQAGKTAAPPPKIHGSAP